MFNFVRRANAEAGALRMLAGVVSGLAESKSVSQQNIASHCEVAQRISERLRLGVDVRTKAVDDLAKYRAQTNWDEVLALEPQPHAFLDDDGLDDACLAMADFADLKTPFSVGLSRAVGELTASAARACGLPERNVRDLRRAGYLHDIGQVAVPARVWLKAEPLNDSAREQIRLHTYGVWDGDDLGCYSGRDAIHKLHGIEFVGAVDAPRRRQPHHRR